MTTTAEEAYQKALTEGHSAAWDQDWAAAEQAYRRAAEAAPQQPNALSSLGLALYQLGKFDESLATYQRAAKLAPEDPIPMEKIAQLSERLGDLPGAVDAFMKAAESFLQHQDVDKAIESWNRVTTLQPDQALAHGRLATAHEKLGHVQLAVNGYLAVASLLQRTGMLDQARELVTKAAKLMPDAAEVRQAQSLLKTGQMLPIPTRHKGATAPRLMAQVRKQSEPAGDTGPILDPVAEATQKALTKLAQILFDYDPEPTTTQERHGLSDLLKGTGLLSMQHAETAKVVLHLSQAIEAQGKGEHAAAADELERTLDAGLDHPAVHFMLGVLRLQGSRQETAIRHLARAVKHRDYGLAARLLLGDVLFKKNLFKDASLEYIEALKIADASTAPQSVADEIRESYEPFVEAQLGQTDLAVCRQLCENVRGLLLRNDWRLQIRHSREQSPGAGGVVSYTPLAEVMLAAQSLGVVESITRVRQLAREGSLRSAMDEAYDAVQRAPSYLPLHSLMADLLIQEHRAQEAVDKMAVIARAYGVRGEVAQATKLWRRIIELAPMEMSARSQLIDLLVERGHTDDAIHAYLDLAEVYYRLAELDMARKTLTTALHFVQQANADRTWNLSILQRMADIDMQRLNWKQAVRVYEQIRTLRPDDQAARRQLVDLYTRMGQHQQAIAELDAFLTYLETSGHTADAIPFLEDLIREHEDEPMFRRALAAQLHHANRTQEAVEQLDTLGEVLLQSGRSDEAREVIAQIVSMNPPNAADYRKLLSQMNGSDNGGSAGSTA